MSMREVAGTTVAPQTMRMSDVAGRVTLSALDLQILGMVAEGHQIDVVALRLNLSGRTVRRRTRAMCDRFGARAPIQIAVWAARRGVI